MPKKRFQDLTKRESMLYGIGHSGLFTPGIRSCGVQMTDVEWNEDENQKYECNMAPNAGKRESYAGRRKNVNNRMKGR